MTLNEDANEDLVMTERLVVSPPVKSAWQEPRLRFVEPTLTKHGAMVEVTAQGFFGTFVP